MKEKDLTKKVLEAIANELSEVMDFETPIEVGSKRTVTQLKADLLEAAMELQLDDDITDEAKEVLTTLGVKLPEFEPEEKPILGLTKAKTTKAKTAKAKKGPGVITSILEFITDSKKGTTISQIHNQLTSRFPERDAAAMLKTVKAQIAGKKSPCRMEKEKKVAFKIEGDKYAIA